MRNCPFTRGTKINDDKPRFDGGAIRHHEHDADAVALSDAKKQLDVASTALTYAAADMGSVRIDRLAQMENALRSSAAAIRERIEGGPSERHEAVASGHSDHATIMPLAPVVTWTIVGPATFVPEPLNLQWLGAAMVPDSRRKIHFNEMMTVICHDYQVQRDDDTNYVYLLPPAESSASLLTVRSKGFDGLSEHQVQRITYRTLGDSIRRDVLARSFSLKRGTLSNGSEDSLKFLKGTRTSTTRYLGYDLAHLPSQRHDAGKLLRMFDRCECSTCRAWEEWDTIVHFDSDEESYDI